jgi:AcrR family transcriptional regulator
MLQFSSIHYKVLKVKALSRPYHHGNLREALLHLAEKTLEKGGVQSISLRELSRELGVSHTSPRRHFADKQALLDALALRGFERFDETLGRAAGKPGQHFQGRLTKLARAYVGFALKHPALLSLMFEAKHRSDALRDILEASERTFAHAPALFAEAQAAGEVVPGDPSRLAVVVFSSLLGLISMSTHGKFKGVSLDHLTGEIIERMILGFRPRSRSTSGELSDRRSAASNGSTDKNKRT